MMTDTRAVAHRTFQVITDFIESTLPDVDVEPGEGSVLITTLHQDFLINYHGVTQQIWYSSAISGAHHFALGEDGAWHCTRSQDTLYGVLSGELSQLCQRSITIPHA
jgi:frataxin-like iron-binding protein CyaY